MPLDIATAAKILSPVAQKVASILLKKVQSKLNPTELEKALEAGIADALGKLGKVSEAVANALQEKFQDQDEESRVRSSAANALGKLSKQSSSDVVPAVTQWISQHQDSEYVGYGIDALWNLVVGEQS